MLTSPTALLLMLLLLLLPGLSAPLSDPSQRALFYEQWENRPADDLWEELRSGQCLSTRSSSPTCRITSSAHHPPLMNFLHLYIV
ncbi:hypothetical protein GN956_G25425 [Arapaima gigas]